MARPPAFNLPQQDTTARAQGTPAARPVDVSSGISEIGRSLSRVGQAVEHKADVDVQIAQIERAHEEDDARVLVNQTMANVRQRAASLQRDALQNAPDGWRGATETVGKGFADIYSEAMRGAATPSAQRFMGLALDAFHQEVLGSTAEAESTARRAWRVDTTTSTIDTNSSVLAADPSQYEAVRHQTIDLISGLTDVSADQRRDLTSRAEERFAVSAMGGLVERDPRGALNLLRDPEAEGAVAHLNGEQRIAFENRAQAELNRRQAEARAAQAQAVASLRDTVNAQNQLLQRGIVPSQPVDVSQVATLLGPDVAQNYLANLQSASSALEMSTMPSAQVAQVAAGSVTGEGGDTQRLLTAEARQAAGRVLQARHDDPGGYALQNGLMRHGELMTTLGQATAAGPAAPVLWTAVDSSLRDRGADAVELHRRGVTDRIAPLSQGEATALSGWLGQQSAQNRLAFFSRAANAMNPEAYRAMMGQLAPDGAGPVTAFAGAWFGRGDGQEPSATRLSAQSVAQILLRGQEVLHGGAPGEDGRRTSTVPMPAENAMRSAWRAAVGEAYDSIPRAGEDAYQAYRAAYAGLSEREGATDGTNVDTPRATLAASIAAGGAQPLEWAGRQTLIPFGMRVSDFEQGVRRGFQQWSFLRDEDPRNYELRAMGAGRYAVYEGAAPVRTPGPRGVPVTIQVR